MVLKKVSESSRAIFLLRALKKSYNYFKHKIIGIYHRTYVHHRLVDYPVEEVEKENPSIFYNSRVAQGVRNSYRKLQKKIGVYSNTSPLSNLAKAINAEFKLHSVKAASVILISAVVINLALSFIFRRKLEVSGLVMRGMFLIIGIGGLACDADWRTIKRGSIIFGAITR